MPVCRVSVPVEWSQRALPTHPASIVLAEGVGFEPTEVVETSPVFKTGAINRSATPPIIIIPAITEKRFSRPEQADDRGFHTICKSLFRFRFVGCAGQEPLEVCRSVCRSSR